MTTLQGECHDITVIHNSVEITEACIKAQILSIRCLGHYQWGALTTVTKGNSAKIGEFDIESCTDIMECHIIR